MQWKTNIYGKNENARELSNSSGSDFRTFGKVLFIFDWIRKYSGNRYSVSVNDKKQRPIWSLSKRSNIWTKSDNR
jgi:hypothetical protein